MSENEPLLTSWLNAADLDDCRLVLDERGALSAADRIKISHLFAAESRDFPLSIRQSLLRSGLTPTETLDLSRLFVADRVAALGRIKPTLPAGMRLRLVFVPLAHVTAFAAPWDDGYIAVVTGGLFELLRSHAVNSIWAGRYEALERELETSLTNARATLEYLNLRSVLFMLGRLPLAQIDELVTKDIRDAGWRFAEAATLFVMLHEFGHAQFSQLAESEKGEFAASVHLRVIEDATPAKTEEFFADRFVLKCIPADLAGPMIHASLTFFSLLGYLDAGGFLNRDDHPLAVNRLSALLDFADQADRSDKSMEASRAQRETIAQMRTNMADVRDQDAEKRMDRLIQLATARENELDWKLAVKAVCELEQSIKR